MTTAYIEFDPKNGEKPWTIVYVGMKGPGSKVTGSRAYRTKEEAERRLDWLSPAERDMIDIDEIKSAIDRMRNAAWGPEYGQIVFLAPAIYKAAKDAGFDMRDYCEVKPMPMMPSESLRAHASS